MTVIRTWVWKWYNTVIPLNTYICDVYNTWLISIRKHTTNTSITSSYQQKNTHRLPFLRLWLSPPLGSCSGSSFLITNETMVVSSGGNCMEGTCRCWPPPPDVTLCATLAAYTVSSTSSLTGSFQDVHPKLVTSIWNQNMFNFHT